jgi:hypothetical protein
MEKDKISKEQTFTDVLSIIRRTAFPHYCYAKTLLQEPGDVTGDTMVFESCLTVTSNQVKVWM